MTIRELFNLLEEQIKLGHGDYTVMVYTREDVVDLIRDDTTKEIYICSG